MDRGSDLVRTTNGLFRIGWEPYGEPARGGDLATVGLTSGCSSKIQEIKPKITLIKIPNLNTRHFLHKLKDLSAIIEGKMAVWAAHFPIIPCSPLDVDTDFVAVCA